MYLVIWQEKIDVSGQSRSGHFSLPKVTNLIHEMTSLIEMRIAGI